MDCVELSLGFASLSPQLELELDSGYRERDLEVDRSICTRQRWRNLANRQFKTFQLYILR